MSSLLKEMSKPAVLLAAFALVCTLLLALIHAATQERIATNERQALLEQVNTLIAPSRYDNQPLNDQITLPAASLDSAEPVTVYRARAQGQPIAAVFVTSAPDGYSGRIRLVVGVNADQTVAGVRVLAHQETPGLGDRIEASKSPWILEFAGQSLQQPAVEQWAVKKDGGAFDQFTGATITPRAVVGSVKAVLLWSDANWDTLFGQTFEADHELIQ